VPCAAGVASLCCLPWTTCAPCSPSSRLWR
jgi:hypothetical protein